MNIGALLHFLFAFLTKTIPAFFAQPAAPNGPIADRPGHIDRIATLAAKMESRTIAIGPLPRTGGVVHLVSKENAANVASIIVEAADRYQEDEALIAALIDGESRGDAQAINPNLQLAQPGESTHAAMSHTDYGLEQEDGATALGDPRFSGLSDAEIVGRLLSPIYGVDFVCSTLQRNLDWAHRLLTQEPTLASAVPTGLDAIEVIGCNAYNAGPTGTKNSLHSTKPNLAYGIGVVTKANDWRALLDAR